MIDYSIYPKITQLTRNIAIFDCTIEFSQKYAPIHVNVISHKKKNLVRYHCFSYYLSKGDPYFNFLILHSTTHLKDECKRFLEKLEWL